jgi:DNA-binding transcriptional regulator YbjK
MICMAAKTDRQGRDRERPLMEATLRIIGRKGLDGVTHRAVAAEAGLSLGALTHHFATRDALIDAALRIVARSRPAASAVVEPADQGVRYQGLGRVAGRLVRAGT